MFDLIILLIEKRKREEKLDISIIIIIAYVFNYIMMIRNSLSNNNFSHRTSNDKNNTDLKKSNWSSHQNTLQPNPLHLTNYVLYGLKNYP